MALLSAVFCKKERAKDDLNLSVNRKKELIAVRKSWSLRRDYWNLWRIKYFMDFGDEMWRQSEEVSFRP